MTDLPATLAALRPADLPDYMVDAWLSCLHWAAGEADLVAAFRAETGCQWTPGRSPLERQIDEATGVAAAVFTQFVQWFNAAVWGPLDDGAAKE